MKVESQWRRFLTLGDPAANRSTGRMIIRATLVIGVINVLSRMVGLVNSAIIAAVLGAGNAMDAYVVAQVLPSYAINVLSSTLSAAFIPVYIDVRDNVGKAAAQRLFSNVQICNLGILTAIVLVLGLTSGLVLHLLAFGFGPAKLLLTQHLCYLFLPWIIMSGVAAQWSALLNAEEDFSTPALAPNIATMVQVVYLRVILLTFGVFGLVWAGLAGLAMCLILLGWALHRRGIEWMPRWTGPDPNVMRVLRQYLPLVAGGSIASTNPMIDMSMSASLGAGSVSILSYASRVYGILTSVSTTALSTAVLPYFSSIAASRDWMELRRLQKKYIRMILLVTIPIVGAICLTSHWLVREMYQRGHFKASDTDLVAWVQVMIFLNLPCFTAVTLVVRILSALQHNHILTLAATVSFTLNLALDYWLRRVMGVAGIALSTALVYIVSFAFLTVMSNITLNRIIRDERNRLPESVEESICG